MERRFEKFAGAGAVVCAVALILAAMAMPFAAQAQVQIGVTNPSAAERRSETVEVAWSELASRIEGLTPENVIVTGEEGEIPSQVVFEGNPEPQKLIFQVTLLDGQTREYKVSTGIRSAYPAQAYGRFVPERKDDYAWENDIVAFRIYGPALRDELVTGGVDYWSKNTSKLVIDQWYERDLSGRGSYHVDHGEGNDCYKVGPTMGAGSSMILIDGEYRSPENFETWQVLDNGPIRTSVRFTYRPWTAASEQGPDAQSFESGRMTKTISLDAGSCFNKITESYGGFGKMPQVVVGMAVHPGAEMGTGNGYSYLFEPASDSQSGHDGSIGVAVIVPGRSRDIYMEGVDGGDPQTGKLVRIPRDGELVYYTGAISTKGGVVNNSGDWERIVLRKKAALGAPVRVKVY